MNNNYVKINNNIFSTFPSYNFQDLNIKNNLPSTYPKENKDINDIDKSNNKSKKKKLLFGSTVASTILTAGIIGMILAKGMHGGNFSNWARKLSRDIKSSNSMNSKNYAQKTKFYCKKGAKKAVDTLESASNFTPIKDWIFDKICKTNKITKKFCEKTTAFFKKIVDKTLGKKYNKAEIMLKDFSSILKEYKINDLKMLDAETRARKIKIKNVTKTLDEWIALLENQTQNLETTFDKSFSLGARIKRDKFRSSLLKDLPAKIEQRFFKNKGIFKKSSYKKYATADLTKEAQDTLSKQIISARKSLTNNIDTISEGIKNDINALLDVIKPDDATSMEKIKLLKQKLEIFRKCSGKNEAKIRQNISNEINKTLTDLISNVSKNEYSSDEMKIITDTVKEITNSVLHANENSKGALEEIMTILKGLNNCKIISDKNFKEYSKMSKKITKRLRKATDLEMGQYFLKQAELKVGSAPTDVMSVLFPIGAGAYAISKADSKEERVSTTLTTCIPLVGTFATFVYGTTKMFSGAKNLMFSLISGAILGLIGDSADKHINNQVQFKML